MTTTDPELEMQADNGRTLEPFGIVFMILTVPILWAWHLIADRIPKWPWETILWWVSILGFAIAGVGFAILATRFP